MDKKLLIRFLWAALDVGLGRSYGHTGEDTQDCIRFQIATLVVLYLDVDFTPFLKVLHLNGENPGSLRNMQTLVELGVGHEVQDVQEPGIYEMQGWNGGSGHAVTLIRRGDGTLWMMEFTTRTTDGFEPTTWAEVLRRWPVRMLVKLRAPSA